MKGRTKGTIRKEGKKEKDEEEKQKMMEEEEEEEEGLAVEGPLGTRRKGLRGE